MSQKTGPLVFSHIQKTAGQTLRELMRNHFGTQQCDLQMPPENLTAARIRFIRLFYPQLACLSGHAFLPWTPVGDIPGARFFTFLREPVSRTISAYQYLNETGKNPGPYLTFLEKERNRQVNRLCGSQDLDAALEVLQERIGFVGLTERFDESLVLWKHWFNDPTLEIRYQRVNVSSNRTLKEEIQANQEYMDRTREATQIDQELYRIVSEELYPAQQAAYGYALEADVEAFKTSLQEFEAPRGKATVGSMKRNLIFRPCWKLAVKFGL